MAMDSSEANSTQQVPILGGKEHENSTVIDPTLNYEATIKPKKKVHQLYFVKFWPYKDLDEESKISKSQQLVEEVDQKLNRMDQDYKLLKLKWRDTRSQLYRLSNRKLSIFYGLNLQKDLLHHLQLVLDKLNLACKIPLKHKGGPNHTQGFQRWISHGSNNLVIERKFIKEMGRRQPRLNDLDLSTNQSIIISIKFFQARPLPILLPPPLHLTLKLLIVKKISLELRIEQHEVKSTIEGLEKELIPMKEEVFVYYDQRREMLKQKEAAQYCISKLRQTFVEMNGMYDEYVSLLSNAKELARNKDVAALRKLSHQQVEEFMSEWNHPYVKTFKINYEFSILPSLSDRWLSNDGRIGFGDDDRETLQYIKDICSIN
ncbi:hypothetical protein ES288_D02G005100v1 [Gossypium darwinii]|uniref:Uncharacterized protein n=1 Tax=Gossypium darwinii TaxID=34276 RepID=A0A5D2D7L6_GOSDA|nr:hypothetical protein ES288_D02G005100v1 [Gossypium darwinii]